MARVFRPLVPRLGLVLALVLVMTTSALAVGVRKSCAVRSMSAVAQYCEDIPSSIGPQTAGPGTPALAGVLSPGVIRRLTATAALTRSASAGLLSLPAAAVPPPRSRRPPSLSSSVGATDPWSLMPGLVALLAVLAAALAALSAQLRRRHAREA